MLMRQGNMALQRMGASKVRSSIHDNTVVESLPLVRNSQPTSRRIKLLICVLLLLVGFQWFSESFASLGIVGLRTVHSVSSCETTLFAQGSIAAQRRPTHVCSGTSILSQAWTEVLVRKGQTNCRNQH